MRRVSDSHGELKADWIQLSTKLGSLSNLIIDPNWLERWLDENKDTRLENRFRLERRAGKKDLDLGYVPHPKDVDAVINILQLRTVEAKEAAESQPNVRMVKLLNPDIEFKGPGEL